MRHTFKTASSHLHPAQMATKLELPAKVLILQMTVHAFGCYLTLNSNHYFFTDIVFVPENCTSGDVRLIGGENEFEGRVEVCISNVWGTICDSGWDSADASVACGQAGFPGQGYVQMAIAFTMSNFYLVL